MTANERIHNEEAIYDIWLSLKCGYNTAVFSKLTKVFQSAKQIYDAASDELAGAELSPAQIKALSDKSLKDAEDIVRYCNFVGIKTMSYFDSGFPKKLKAIATPPVVLYYFGQWKDIDNMLSIAVVGTRNMSLYGAYAAETLAYGLAQSGAAVVSGLARGIDAKAHIGAIKAGGYTVGFCGTSVDKIYPRENAALFGKMCETQLVISEFSPLAQSPHKYSFPLRNRLISGICDATVVVEAGEKSGALITADNARKQSRGIFAVSNQSENSQGTIALLKRGAACAVSAAAIMAPYADKYADSLKISSQAAEPLKASIPNGTLEAEPIIYTRKMFEDDGVREQPSYELTPLENEVLETIKGTKELSADEIIAALDVPPRKVTAALTKLQILNLAERSATGLWSAK